MLKNLEKISLWIIYAGLGICLATPLFIHNGFFFPFITTKAFVFRIVVEIMLLAYLFLAWRNETYRPKLNLVFIFLCIFLFISFISSFLGPDFYTSFWGDMERSEGILLWLHLLVFFLVTTSVLGKNSWLKFLDFSLVIAILTSLFGIGQALGLESLLRTSGTRVDSTLGNPSFFAAYLFFHIAFAAYLWWFKKSASWKVYYTSIAVLFSWLVFATQTRGAALGYAAGVFLACLLLAFTNRGHKSFKIGAISISVFLILFTAGIYLGRDSSFVQNSAILSRLASISTQEKTAQTRLLTWEAAWQGFKQRPILGWGMENFELVFNYNFPPKIYEDEGSVVWFDRAHNVFLDRLTTTGILGLLAFLTFLLYPATYAIRKLLPNDDQRAPAIIIICLTVAYFIQDMFVFESMVVYVILFFAWAFFASLYLPQTGKQFMLPKPFWLGALIVYLLLLGPLQWNVNILPASANMAMVSAGNSDPENDDFFVIVDKFKKAIEPNTYGREEYRLQFVEFVGLQLANLGPVNDRVKPVLAYVDEQLDKQLAEFADNAKNWLLAMRHYNYTNSSLPDKAEERLNKSASFYDTAHILSPTRPHFQQEAGFAHTYLYRLYSSQGKVGQANEALAAAEKYFLETLELNPSVVESHINLVMLYLNTKDKEKLEQTVSQMRASDAPFRKDKYLRRLMSLCLANKNYDLAAYFSEETVKLKPSDPQRFIDTALAYAYAGNRTRAIEFANKIKAFGGAYVDQAEEFIRNVNTGYFENNPPK